MFMFFKSRLNICRLLFSKLSKFRVYTRVYTWVFKISGFIEGVKLLGIPGYTWVYPGIPRHTQVFPDIPRYTRVYPGIPGYTQVYPGTWIHLCIPWVYPGFQNCLNSGCSTFSIYGGTSITTCSLQGVRVLNRRRYIWWLAEPDIDLPVQSQAR